MGDEQKKPYDLAALGLKLKGIGLEGAEKLAGEVYGVLKEWVTESAHASANPFDDLAIPFLKQADAYVLPQIDAINGKQDQP